jgi:dolichol kinase
MDAITTAQTLPSSALAVPPPLTYSGELKRKALHLSSLWIPVGALLAGREAALWILVPLAALTVGLDLLRARHAGVRGFIHGQLGFMMRPHELQEETGRSRLTGSSWMLIAAVATFALFPLQIAVAAFAMLIVCDTAAALVGRRWGRMRYGPLNKSVEGSLAFFATALAVAWLTPGLAFAVGALGAAGATVGEAVAASWLDDNLSVPLAGGVAMALALAAGLG